MSFEGQTIIVTGGSEGIGFATARRLAAGGAHVALFARRPDVLEAAAEAIRAAGGSAETASLDVAETDKLVAAIRGVAARRGRLDGLVNNAFESVHGLITETSQADWRRSFEVNVEAPFIAIQTALPIMAARRRGSIVNIASLSGVRARPASAAYAASKAAIIHLSAIAAVEAAEAGVRVNTVIPGATNSASWKRAVAERPEINVQGAIQQIPLGRLAEPEDVAKAVCFLLSDEAEFITGAELRAEGGAYWRR